MEGELKNHRRLTGVCLRPLSRPRTGHYGDRNKLPYVRLGEISYLFREARLISQYSEVSRYECVRSNLACPDPRNSCRANVWTQAAARILYTAAFGGAYKGPFVNAPVSRYKFSVVFSALRAYALSDRNAWLAALIILLALPPSVTVIVSVFSATLL